MVYIDDVQQVGRSFWSQGTYVLSQLLSQRSSRSLCQGYNVTGRIDVLEEPHLEFRVHLIDLKTDDSHNMQLDPKHIPVPIVNDRRHGTFRLPLGLRIVCVSNFVN